MQDVLPPMRMVSGPGVGIVPRTPQNRIYNVTSLIIVGMNLIDSLLIMQIFFCKNIPQELLGGEFLG